MTMTTGASVEPMANGSSGSRLMTSSTSSAGSVSACSASCCAAGVSASACGVAVDLPQKKTATSAATTPRTIRVGINHRRVELVFCDVDTEKSLSGWSVLQRAPKRIYCTAGIDLLCYIVTTLYSKPGLGQFSCACIDSCSLSLKRRYEQQRKNGPGWKYFSTGTN